MKSSPTFSSDDDAVTSYLDNMEAEFPCVTDGPRAGTEVKDKHQRSRNVAAPVGPVPAGLRTREGNKAGGQDNVLSGDVKSGTCENSLKSDLVKEHGPSCTGEPDKAGVHSSPQAGGRAVQPGATISCSDDVDDRLMADPTRTHTQMAHPAYEDLHPNLSTPSRLSVQPDNNSPSLQNQEAVRQKPTEDWLSLSSSPPCIDQVCLIRVLETVRFNELHSD